MATKSTSGDRFTVVRAREARAFVDGDEAVELYFTTQKITFAIQSLPPGGKTPMDPGQPGVYVEFVLEGEAIFEAGDDSGETIWLHEGDAVLVREGLPHKVTNPTAGMSRVILALAPGMTEVKHAG